MNQLFVVRFVRNDGKPDEEYVYNTFDEAQRHLDLFRNDDSGLYAQIDIRKLYPEQRQYEDSEIER